MKVGLRSMSDFTKLLQYASFYGFVASAGVVLANLLVSMAMELPYWPLDWWYRNIVFYSFYTSFGMWLCLLVMMHHKWPGFTHLLMPFGWVACYRVLMPLDAWLSGAAVSPFDLGEALAILTAYLLIIAFLYSSIISEISNRLIRFVSSKESESTGDQSKWIRASSLQGCPSLTGGKGLILRTIAVCLIIDSAAMMWQSSSKWLSLRFDVYLLRAGNFYGPEFFIPVFFNLLAVVLIFRGWKNVFFWLPYLLIFLTFRAFNPPWEGWLPTPVYILWVDRALVVLILVNTLWTFSNWLNTRKGIPPANV